ncbi:MAG: DsbA family protein [Pseudomonadota bacterium]
MRPHRLFPSLTRFVVGLGVVMTLATGAWAQSFNDAQKLEMENIIREYLLKNPEILRDAFGELERRERVAKEEEARKGIVENKEILYNSKLSYVAGNKDGDVAMVEFFDYNCGFCKRAFGDVLAIMESDKNLKVVVKEFPILGEGSMFASRAAIASKAQNKYWEFHVALMQARGALDQAKVLEIAAGIGLDLAKLQQDMKAPNVEAEIKETYELASKLGVNGTPAFVIDNTLIPGAMGLPALQQQVATVRESGGCQVC